MQNSVMRPQWLELARRFQALAQSGLAYCKDPYDRERYEEIRRLAAEMMALGAGLRDAVPILDLFKDEVGYATPKIDVRAAVFDGGRILFVRGVTARLVNHRYRRIRDCCTRRRA